MARGPGPEYDALKPRLRRLLGELPSFENTFLRTLPRLAVPADPVSDESIEALLEPGAACGPYRLQRLLAEGGMGSVWLAERPDGLINRPVALKLPRLSWDNARLRERIARERDILAALTHPNIARLYDAGLMAEGRPYLALEYVDGQPIDEYCRSAGLDVRARVCLFLQVARAVAYAHAALVIHRDLKPANILVTADGEVHLLDFGIATLLEEGRASHSTLTELAGRPLTPEYASPEQIAGEPLAVATDVYSLGIVLFELLTGERPYRLRRGSRAELEDAIVDADVPRPSHRAVDPSVRKALRGDLDTIVTMALRKRPDARYASVEAFAADLVRFLDGRPVHARPHSAGYRMRKFVARHRLGVGAMAATLVAGDRRVDRDLAGGHRARRAGPGR
jgi:serine/threonine protein kinase